MVHLIMSFPRRQVQHRGLHFISVFVFFFNHTSNSTKEICNLLSVCYLAVYLKQMLSDFSKSWAAGQETSDASGIDPRFFSFFFFQIGLHNRTTL